ncbi:MAG: hypothetical protein ACRD35_05395 [Candidatus Acidiferrales bacterium]
MGQLRSLRFTFTLALVLILCAPPAGAQRGGMVVPQNLAEMVEEADIIVLGRVLNARGEKHPELQNLNTVVVTLQVSEIWKGSAGPTLTFRQYVWDFRDSLTALGYRKGQEVLLLLLQPNENGLSSTVGLQQGRFRILRDAQGNRQAVNGFDNRGLFREMDSQMRQKGVVLTPRSAGLLQKHQRGPIALDELKSLVRQLAGQS